MMFESILLHSLLAIALKCPNKRETIIQVFYVFAPSSSASRLHLLHAIKQRISTQLPSYLLLPYSSVDEDLYNLFYYHAVLSLDHPSPLTRTNGLKVLDEIAKWNYRPILDKMLLLQRSMKDNWWEARAQCLCICANLLLFLNEEENEILQRSNQAVQEVGGEEKLQNENQDSDLKIQQELLYLAESKAQLLSIVQEIFIIQASQNVIRIGLIYLSPVLTKYPELCPRYLEILLSIDSKIRETVLMTNPPPGMENGQVVSGCNSFKYRLTGAPITWNSVGIAQAIDTFVKLKQLQNFEYEHLEIILACLYNDLQMSDGDIWLMIYENIKNLLFLALSEQDLCEFASEILKKFFMFETIQEKVMQNSLKIFLKLLSLIYHPDVQDSCKENLLVFFEFLNERGVSKFLNYCYDIIKQFSERYKDMFLRSNLVGFMNGLAKEKRKELLGDEIY